MEISVDPDLAGKVVLGFFINKGLSVCPPDEDYWQEIETFIDYLRNKYAGYKITDVPGVSETRKLYHSFGLDPTRYRPSSEALLRRVLKTKSLYRVNTVVDVCNFYSLQFQLSMGLYDACTITGDVVLRMGIEGEGYEGIRKNRVNVEGKIVLVDKHGPFGNPSADFSRTRIRSVTRDILLVVFCPPSVPENDLLAKINELAVQMIRRNGGDIVVTGIVE